MRILHFILGKADKRRASGVNQVVAGLAKYSVRQGVEVRVIGKAETSRSEGERICRDGFEVIAYSRLGRALWSALDEGIKWADIVHLHGVYSPLNLLVGRMAESRNKPYLVTLHNGLSPQLALQSGRWKKSIFNILLQKRHLGAASALHVLTDEEATDVVASAAPARMFCLPNGIDLEEIGDMREPVAAERREVILGYLGRISPEKNLEALCEAFWAVNVDKSMRLIIAGPSSDYAEKILTRYGKSGVELIGPRYGSEKYSFIAHLDLFILPSLAEGFSIAAAEVLALGTPLLVTRTSKMSYFFDTGAFFMCEPTPYGLEKGIRQAMSSRSDWPDKMERGRKLVREKLNWSVVARALIAEYEQVLETRKP